MHDPRTFIWGKVITAARYPTTDRKSSSHCDIAIVTLVVDDSNNDVQHKEQVHNRMNCGICKCTTLHCYFIVPWSSSNDVTSLVAKLLFWFV